MSQTHNATVPDSALRVVMNGLENNFGEDGVRALADTFSLSLSLPPSLPLSLSPPPSLSLSASTPPLRRSSVFCIQ
jgi:hypothetical protein